MSIMKLYARLIAVLVIIAICISFTTTSYAESGENLFQSKGCVACHTIGKGKLTGPDLLGVTKRREKEWLRQWLKSPDTMILTDPIAKEMLKEFFVPMPNQGLTDDEIELLIEYFEESDEELDESNESEEHDDHESKQNENQS